MPDEDLRSRLADAQNAIGQVIRHAESWGTSFFPLDPGEIRRVLLDICGPWAGGLRIPDEAPGRIPEVGVAMIRAERARQVAVKGYDEEHDAEHTDGELVLAAVAYAADVAGATEEHADSWWPFSPASFKPGPEPLDSLVKAGALIAAEIDRIVALAAKGSSEERAGHAER